MRWVGKDEFIKENKLGRKMKHGGIIFPPLFPPILLLTELILLKASTRTNISRQAELFREITRKFYLYCFLKGSQKEILIFRSLVVVSFTGFLRKKYVFCGALIPMSHSSYFITKLVLNFQDWEEHQGQ